MRVLSTRNPKSWEIERTCTGNVNEHGDDGCQALLAVSEDDIFILCDYGHLEGEDEQVYVFQCPECGKFTSIKKEDLPEAVRQKAIDRFWKNMNP